MNGTLILRRLCRVQGVQLYVQLSLPRLGKSVRVVVILLWVYRKGVRGIYGGYAMSPSTNLRLTNYLRNDLARHFIFLALFTNDQVSVLRFKGNGQHLFQVFSNVTFVVMCRVQLALFWFCGSRSRLRAPISRVRVASRIVSRGFTSPLSALSGSDETRVSSVR